MAETALECRASLRRGESEPVRCERTDPHDGQWARGAHKGGGWSWSDRAKGAQ